jgi:hypothetical protein
MAHRNEKQRMSNAMRAASLSLGVALALVVASCSTQPGGPVSPTGALGGTAASESPSPTPTPTATPTPTPTPGVGCSPGYWKNHLAEFKLYCEAAADEISGDRFDTCDQLLAAMTPEKNPPDGCKGSDAYCGRSEAAGLMNLVSGCTED